MEYRLCYLILVTHHFLGPIDTAASVRDNKYLGQRFLKKSLQLSRMFNQDDKVFSRNKALIPFSSFLPSWLHTHDLTPVVSLLGCPASSGPLLRLCTCCYPTSTSYSTWGYWPILKAQLRNHSSSPSFPLFPLLSYSISSQVLSIYLLDSSTVALQPSCNFLDMPPSSLCDSLHLVSWSYSCPVHFLPCVRGVIAS